MAVEDNIHLMRRWFHEVWNEGRTQTVFELLSPTAVARGQRDAASEIRGPQEFVNFVNEIRGSFSDMKLKIEDIFGTDDKVVVRWSATMTHSGNALGLAPTGKIVHVGGISIARVDGGKIVEGWDNWDQIGMLQQIGAYKQPDARLVA